MCMCLFSCVCQSLNSYFRMKCVYWQWFSEVFLSPCSDFQQRTVSGFSVLFFSKITPIHYWFLALPLVCSDFSSFSFNNIVSQKWWNPMLCFSLANTHSIFTQSLCAQSWPFTANMTNNAWSSYKLKVCFPCYVISLLICWCVFSNLLNLRVMYESW